MFDDVLQVLESMIEQIARRFKIAGDEFEDLVQLGRIAAWELCEQHAITRENLSQYRGLVYTAVKRAMQSEYRASKAQKRMALNTAISLDAPLSEETDTNRYEFIPAPEQEAPFEEELQRELLVKLKKQALRERTPEAIRAVVWLLVHMLGIERQEIPKRLSYRTFVERGLQHYLWVFFNNSPYRAVNFAYKGEFLPHHTLRAGNKYWFGKKGRQRAITALQKALGNSGYEPESYPKLVTVRFLEEARLYRPLVVQFGEDRFAYLDACYPDTYYPWEFSVTPQGFFDDESNIIWATRWLVETVYEYPMEEMTVFDTWEQRIALIFTRKVFEEHGLRAVMAKCDNQPENALRLAYPEHFLPWSFPYKGKESKWQGRSGKRLAVEATRWVIEEYAGIEPSEDITYDFFVEHGLRGMITAKSLGFNSSPTAALRNAYPHIKWYGHRRKQRWKRKR